jgi:F0F1-type ATP synthase assembly protein I
VEHAETHPEETMPKKKRHRNSYRVATFVLGGALFGIILSRSGNIWFGIIGALIGLVIGMAIKD